MLYNINLSTYTKTVFISFQTMLDLPTTKENSHSKPTSKTAFFMILRKIFQLLKAEAKSKVKI